MSQDPVQAQAQVREQEQVREIVILFEQERDTKRTRRYAEAAVQINGEDAVVPASGTLYVQQWALQEAYGKLPESLVITIRVHEAA